MSNSSLQNSDKPAGACSPTIGYRFNTKSEELGELQSEPGNHDIEATKSDVKTEEENSNPTLLTSGSLDGAKSEEDKNEMHGDTVKDYWGLLGRSISVDSTYESPFSNPIETWRKLHELKGKITKTVEGKISEMKMNCNVPSHSKLVNSKENSSISDSEDTSESSKLSEQCKDAEDLNLSLKKVINKTNDSLNAALQNIKSEVESEAELKNRKSHTKFSDSIKIHDIKIATAKSDTDSSILDESFTAEIESGVEADEHFDSISIDAFEEPVLEALGGSQTPPGGANGLLNFIFGLKHSRMFTCILVIGFGIYMALPVSDFTRGFMFCLLLMFLILKMKHYLQGDDSIYIHQGPFIMPDYKNLPPLKVPEYKPVKGVWINEYERETYDPDYYSVTQTLPAYLELDNSILKLSRPKGKVNKRATIDEPEYKLPIISQRVYNISGCNIFLMPEGLTRKRLYSKKYPIVIFLRPDSFIGEKIKEKLDEKEGGHETAEGNDINLTNVTEPSESRSSLYLFARCDRQKEEWYRKLLAATRLIDSPVHSNEKPAEDVTKENLKKEATTPFENLCFDAEVAYVEEYLRYMAQFVDREEISREAKKINAQEVNSSYKKRKTKKKDASGPEENVEHVNSLTIYRKEKGARMSPLHLNQDLDYEENVNYTPQIQWFNAFLNRILFDMFRSPYWLAKIHEKVYKKLNSIRLPYYVEDIEVIEMDLGKTGPMFHRVSQPYIDERGLWFDMDTTFEGLIRLTIQTHLNLVKLQKGMEEIQKMTTILEKPEKGKKKSKEVRDHFPIKESIEKSKENINETNKKLEKEIDGARSQSSSVELELEDVPRLEKSENSLSKRSESSDIKLLNEVARLAEIAIEEGIEKSSLKDRNDRSETLVPEVEALNKKSKSAIYDSDVEDSAESSEDDIEEEDEIPATLIPPETEEQEPVSIAKRYPKNRRSSKKIFRMFENVAQSKYFKSVANSKYVQKAIAGVSATKLRLTLEIKSCSGTLAVNIPPPPSDRFWYGFREMPKLIFSAYPKIGEKPVRFSQIKNYLQKKILHEIKKAMVVPNMIDLVLLTSVPEGSSSSS